MFNKIKEYLSGEIPLDVDYQDEPTDNDIHLASAVLLLDMAGIDNDFAPEEVKTIAETIKTNYNISHSDTVAVLKDAEKYINQKNKINDFVATLNARFSDKQKTKVLAMLWKVVYADGKLEKKEERFITQMKYRLQLKDKDIEEAKHLALTNQV